MSGPFSRRLARELLNLSRRAQPTAKIKTKTKTKTTIHRTFPSSSHHQTRFFSNSVRREFDYRSAFREAPKPGTKPTRPTKPGPHLTPPPPQPPPRTPRRLGPLPVLAAGGGLATLLFTLIQPESNTPSPTPQPTPRETSGDSDDGLPRYHISEVKQHGPDSERPWVMYEDKIYDITDWVGAHPGGEVILRAAGSSIEPYWDIFSIHKTPYVREILEQYLVGKIHPDDLVDGRPSREDIEDPFETDPQRDPRLRVITQKPCNAETRGDELADSFLTPNEVFYVRNHMWVPVVDEAEADNHNISIELPDGDVKTYTLRDLKARFRQYTVSAVLQCSGNRRSDMTAYAKKTNGLQWTTGGISCAQWHGVRLRDVLADAGLTTDDPDEDAQHVQFSGLEAYGASIPIATALDPHGDVLLAFGMNGRPLPRDHGFPLRVIVPGHVAARCVKWVNKIVVSDEESNSQWQRRDYKCFGPNERGTDWDRYKAIQVMPVTSAITRTRVKPPANIAPQQQQQPVVQLEGYAYSGGGHEIQRVDVSLDGGKTWDQARLLDDRNLEKGSKAWCWKRWRYDGVLPGGVGGSGGGGGGGRGGTGGRSEIKTTFMVKATDDAYNTQPEHHASIYNPRGNLATAWHRVEFDYGKVTAGKEASAQGGKGAGAENGARESK